MFLLLLYYFSFNELSYNCKNKNDYNNTQLHYYTSTSNRTFHLLSLNVTWNIKDKNRNNKNKFIKLLQWWKKKKEYIVVVEINQNEKKHKIKSEYNVTWNCFIFFTQLTIHTLSLCWWLCTLFEKSLKWFGNVKCACLFHSFVMFWLFPFM